MKKVCLAAPPVSDFYFSPMRNSNLGLTLVKKILEEQNFECSLFNFPIQKQQTIPLPQALSYLKPFINYKENGPLQFFKQYKHFGPSISECGDQLLNEKPDFIFISVFAFAYADTAIALINYLKENSDVLIVTGGAGVSVHPDFFVQHSSSDYLFTGEAEEIISAVMKYLAGETSERPNGFYSTNEKKTFLNAAAPVHIKVPWSIVKENAAYVKISVMLSRGCPLRCSFCANRLVHSPEFRIGDLQQFADSLPPFNKTVLFNFEDDNICYNTPALIKLLVILKIKYHSMEIIFENGLDYRLLTTDFLKVLISFGLTQLNVSLGTLGDSNIKQEKRPSKIDSLYKLLKCAEDLGIPAVTYFIAGLKNDTSEIIIQTIKLLSEFPTQLGFSPFYPVPGLNNFPADMFSKTEQIPLVRGSSCYPWNNTINTEELITFFRFSRTVNYCKKMKSKELYRETANKNLFPVFFSKELKFINAPAPELLKQLTSTISDIHFS